jgi:hypothetical protein
MALLKGRLFAGALFAGALLAGQQAGIVPQPVEESYARGGGAWQPVANKKILKLIQGEIVSDIGVVTDEPELEHISVAHLNTRKSRSRAVRRSSEELLLLS